MANLEGDCKWTFATLRGNEMGQSAQNAVISHFNKSPYTSLIRESIQNSLDAVHDVSLPVIVEYSFSRIQASEYPNFFELKEHIAGIQKSFPHNREAIKMAERMTETFIRHASNQRMPFIKVSDYNTKGMPFSPKGQGKSPFSSFLRITGDSLKENAGSGGSYGFGKAAYFNISPIRTVLVSTCTVNGECFFEGGAMLTDHYHDNVEKSYFGFYDNRDGFSPINNRDEIPKRFVRNESGTDFFIMGVNATSRDSEAAYKEMTEAVLRHFWLAILHHRLMVRIGDTEINSENIAELMYSYFPDERDDKNRSQTYNPRPFFDAVAKANTSTHFVFVEKEIPILGKVALYLNKVKDAKDKFAYMRSPRMYIFSKQSQTSYGCYGLFLCDNKEGNEFLGKLENAAHREWDPDNCKDEKQKGIEAIKAIRQFISETLESLFASEDDIPLGISGLEEYLHLEDDIIPTEEDDIKDNPFFGNPTGEIASEGTSLTTVITPTEPNYKEPHSSKSGEVVANVITTAKSDPSGILGGNEQHPSTNRHNRRPAPGEKPKAQSDEPSAQEGTYQEFIPVKFRVIASRNPQGKILHSIIIYSPRDIEEGMIELFVAGEQINEEIEIADTDIGDFNDNKIFGINFFKGKNVFTVSFRDALKHSIIIKTYEYK